MPNKTLTQVPVTATDFQWLLIRQNEEGALECVGRYRVKTTTGAQIGPYREVAHTLTPSERTTILTFATTVMAPEANAQEGT